MVCLNDISWHLLCGSKLMPEVYLLSKRNIVFSLLYLGAFVVYNSHCDCYSTLQNMKFRSIDPSIMWVYRQIGHWSSVSVPAEMLMEFFECSAGDASEVLWVYHQRCRWSPVSVPPEMLMESCECTRRCCWSRVSVPPEMPLKLWCTHSSLPFGVLEKSSVWLREGRIKLSKRRVSHCLFWLLFNLKMNSYQILY